MINLDKIQKAARYAGGEFNSPDTGKERELDYCMCFPDMYEVAMSNLGIRILCDILNAQKNAVCERCFTPAEDLAAELKKCGEPLFSIETKRPLSGFDILGFSFQYEMSYSNFLYMLDLAGIPFYASERGDDMPVIMGGGPCMVNPEPVADFLDIIVVGDGEEVIKTLARLYIKNKRRGGTKADYLKSVYNVRGVYVPAMPGKAVQKAVVADLDRARFPIKPLIPNIEIVHDRAVLELFRGCSRGCRFCQAGFIYRPVRRRSAATLKRQAAGLIKNSGYDELSLSSLSTGDYPALAELIEGLRAKAEERCFSLSLPSLRMDSFDAEATENAKKSSLTFAPEAGTQRLRNVINKNITDENIFRTLTDAFGRGYNSIKLYFMLGLPTETREDIEGIVTLAKKIKAVYYGEKRAKPLRLNVSASVFIPKPHTPFQWAAFADGESARAAQEYLKSALRAIGVTFSYHDYDTSYFEAVFARGDRALSKVLAEAYRAGAKMDGWSEFFKPDIYRAAFIKCGVAPEKYLSEIPRSAPLPWDFVDINVSKEYLIREREKAECAVTTEDCLKTCGGCGAC